MRYCNGLHMCRAGARVLSREERVQATREREVSHRIVSHSLRKTGRETLNFNFGWSSSEVKL
jgi:hypothetical protein